MTQVNFDNVDKIRDIIIEAIRPHTKGAQNAEIELALMEVHTNLLLETFKKRPAIRNMLEELLKEK